MLWLRAVVGRWVLGVGSGDDRANGIDLPFPSHTLHSRVTPLLPFPTLHVLTDFRSPALAITVP